MNVKICKSEKGGNTGSVHALVSYLEKENKGKGLGEKQMFFSHDRDRVSRFEVSRDIDLNVKNLGRKDSKFFLINLSPSKDELSHMGNDPEKLRAYTRKVMEGYAENFGKGLSGKDLVYYAKIEYERKYRGDHEKVKSGEAKAGDKKPGLQTHIHVIVSRKDRANKIKLSPLSRHRNTQKGAVRGGFDREAFAQKVEKIWDEEMGYQRETDKSFAYHHVMKHGSPAKRHEMKEVAAAEAKTPMPKANDKKRPSLKDRPPRTVQRGRRGRLGMSLGRAVKKSAGYQREQDLDLWKVERKEMSPGI